MAHLLRTTQQVQQFVIWQLVVIIVMPTHIQKHLLTTMMVQVLVTRFTVLAQVKVM
jgi:hypothetical protein